VQPLQQRRSPPRFPLQAPIPTQKVHEILLIDDLELGSILVDSIEDVGGDERRARGVRLFVGPGGFSRLEDATVAVEGDAEGGLARGLTSGFASFDGGGVLREEAETGQLFTPPWLSLGSPYSSRVSISERKAAHLRMLLAVSLELPIRVTLLHLELEAMIPRAGDMEGSEAVAVGTLDAGSYSFATEVADLLAVRGRGKVSLRRARAKWRRQRRTSFHRFFEMFSTPSIGSM
jgi:hypothetical protein